MTNNEPDYDNLYFERKPMTDLTSQSPRNDLAITPQVSDLTEQWRKGELPEGWYYVTYGEEKTPEPALYGKWYDRDNNERLAFEADNISAVIAPVPSYEEYERILVENDSLKQIRDELDCAVTQLREDITDYKETIDEQERELSDSAFREDNLEKENAHLVEQLIQAKQAMSQALSYLACMDRISDTEPNEQLAFDVLRKCLEELDNA